MRRVEQPPAPATRAASRRAMISAWAVGSWRSSRSLWPLASDLAVAHHHRADRHVVVFQRTLGLAQGQAHEVVVAWEEALAHRSARGLCDSACRSPAPQHIIITQTDTCSPLTAHAHIAAALPRALPAPVLRPRCARRAHDRRPGARVLRRARRSRACRRCRGRQRYARDEVVVGTPRRARRRSRHGERRARRAEARPSELRPPTRVLRLAPASASPPRCGACAPARRDVGGAGLHRRTWRAECDPRRPRARRHAPGDWQELQWNFVGPFGVNAPEAWANVAADGAPGRAGRDRRGARHGRRLRQPRAVPPLARLQPLRVRQRLRLRRDTIPTRTTATATGRSSPATIAEATNNRYGLTGLAYGARIMPVRVLDSQGEGEASTIAEGVASPSNTTPR